MCIPQEKTYVIGVYLGTWAPETRGVRVPRALASLLASRVFIAGTRARARLTTFLFVYRYCLLLLALRLFEWSTRTARSSRIEPRKKYLNRKERGYRKGKEQFRTIFVHLAT